MSPKYLSTMVVFASLAVALAGQAPQQGTKFIGTWKLDAAHSRYTPGPTPKAETVTVTATEVSIEGTNPDGSAYHVSYTPINGQSVPVTGGAPNETTKITRVSDRVLQLEMTAGQAKRKGRATLSARGQSVTVNVKGTDAEGKPISSHEVYIRQP